MYDNPELEQELFDEGPTIGGQLDGMDDSVLDEIVDSDNADPNKETMISIVNTNARSLCPKIDSLIDCFEELDATIGVVTETWLADGDSLNRDLQDLAKGAGLEMICLNRRPNNRRVAQGGVAVVSNIAACTLRRVDFPNPDNYEVLVMVSNIPGFARKLFTVACYILPNYPVPRCT